MFAKWLAISPPTPEVPLLGEGRAHKAVRAPAQARGKRHFP